MSKRAKPDPVLVAAFRGLNANQRGNFEFHLRKRTPIVCSGMIWLDGNGGG